MTALDESYRFCAAVTHDEARNFWYGIRLLPAEKRRAMSAIYAFARWIDDIGDGDETPDAKQSQLADARRLLGDLSGSEHPIAIALTDSIERFDLPLTSFADLIDGVEMDIDGTTYRTFAELVIYCRRVAGSIGQLSTAVFGVPDRDEAEPLADALGVALQQTNILRDIREDALRGRRYLPTDELEIFGCQEQDSPELSNYIRFAGRRALTWYDRGLRLVPMLDRRSAACCSAMAGIYHRLLHRIIDDPSRVLAGRVSLPGWEKAYVAGRSLAGVSS